MTILPPAVLTTAQLVGGLVASAKNARELAKLTSDHALKASVSELYDSLLDVKERVLDLDEENRHLKEELERKDEIVGPEGAFGYFYLKNKSEQPLCPKCLQSQPRNPVFLRPLRKHKGGMLRRCPVCNFGIYEEPPTTGPAIAIGPSLSSSLRGYV
jgi:hypothetical protein